MLVMKVSYSVQLVHVILLKRLQQQVLPLKKQGCLPEGALREVGEYEVDVQLHDEVTQV